MRIDRYRRSWASVQGREFQFTAFESNRSPTLGAASMAVILSVAREWPVRRADSTGRCNTLITAQAEGVLQMKCRTRTYYTDGQKALMWERWKQGWTLHQIGKLFDGHTRQCSEFWVRLVASVRHSGIGPKWR